MAKYLSQSSGRLTEVAATVTSAGVGSAGAIPALDSSGRLDNSVMPVGIGAETAQITATEAIAAGAVVNVYNSSGSPRVRNADATSVGKEATGFVLSSVANAGTATVYFEGSVTGLTGLTPGAPLYITTTPGMVSSTAPSATGNVSQQCGVATSTTTFTFSALLPITLA